MSLLAPGWSCLNSSINSSWLKVPSKEERFPNSSPRLQGSPLPQSGSPKGQKGSAPWIPSTSPSATISGWAVGNEYLMAHFFSSLRWKILTEVLGPISWRWTRKAPRGCPFKSWKRPAQLWFWRFSLCVTETLPLTHLGRPAGLTKRKKQILCGSSVLQTAQSPGAWSDQSVSVMSPATSIWGSVSRWGSLELSEAVTTSFYTGDMSCIKGTSLPC